MNARAFDSAPQMPTVSVVVCFLNPGAYLLEAIESVRRQTYPHWQLILVDDGSDDGSSRLAREAAESDPRRILYAEHEGHANRGKSSSRNLGLRQATGTYVVFLDADDQLLPHKLQHQVQKLESDQQLDAIYGRTRYWYPEQPSPSGRSADFLSRLWVAWDRTYEPPELLVRFLEQPGSVPCLCAPMIRRQLVLDFGGFDESIQHLYEDQVVLAKLAIHGRIYVDRDCGENYRQHAGSTSAQAVRDGIYHPWKLNPARELFLKWLAGYAQQHSLGDHRRLQRALRKAQRPYRHPRLYRWLGPVVYLAESLRDRIVARCCPE